VFSAGKNTFHAFPENCITDWFTIHEKPRGQDKALLCGIGNTLDNNYV